MAICWLKEQNKSGWDWIRYSLIVRVKISYWGSAPAPIIAFYFSAEDTLSPLQQKKKKEKEKVGL